MTTTVVFVIALLAFAFGFGNGLALGVRLGVATWIAPLVAPAVDLSVMALLAVTQYLRAQGVEDRLTGARMLLVLCGLMTFALNTAMSLLTGAWGRACFDAVAPTLLIGWSEVAPRLLVLLHQSTVPDAPADGQQIVPDGPGTVPGRRADRPDAGTALPSGLVKAARQADAAHRKATGRPITRDELRAQLRVSNALAGQLVQQLRAANGT
ncbi:hypothetical protein [Pseudofrankia sp. DC12]|uniref:hypothetical protein n=1 Tax=Pseudofrankia sp. DC12 TaxID=683315 RepID=UPI0005F872D0|nr:hypothetical protein [Pseudofrankia sp. DC12]